VQVDLVGMAARTDDNGDPDPKLPKRPAYASGSIMLPVPPKQRTLAVKVTPAAAKLSPGEATKLAVEVRDAMGRPVPNAEAAVIVVDEAVLALTGYQFPNPVDTFYPERGTDTRDYYSRSYVKLARPDASALQANAGPRGGGMAPATGAAMPPPEAAPAAPMMEREEEGKMGKKDKGKQFDFDADQIEGELATKKPPSAAGPAIAIRSNFNPLAAFSPAVKTGPDGKAIVDVKLPDNLTRYRVVAVAVAGTKQYGRARAR
jgi:uncharacterized protein YfaS (alpha-2-macroglobulin family)